jgi:predicted amidophosphoribosyltransferase
MGGINMGYDILNNPENNKLAVENRYWLGTYYPWNMRQYKWPDTFSVKIMDVKAEKEEAIAYFVHLLEEVLDFNNPYVVCIFPPSESGNNSSGIKKIAKKMCSLHYLVDGTDILVRTKSTTKRREGGSRDSDTQLDSLDVTNEEILKGQRVLLLDDVTTSGNSFHAGRFLLKEAGASVVACLALGKTYDNYY